MKMFLAVLISALLPTMALAHETGPAHAHPHADWTVMLVLGAVVAFAALFVLRRRNTDKDD